MHKTYITPGGRQYDIYSDMLAQTHLLIAGTTGSGKSVIINGIITTALFHADSKYRFIFIDPKRVELSEYKNIPHCLKYASEPQDIVNAFNFAMGIIENRYKAMQKENTRLFSGSNLYIVIDELADLMTTNRKQIQPLIQRIAQIGRAAKVHIIAATQCPLVTVIPTQIKVNFDSIVALHTRSAQDSRNITGFTGCELLPRYGQGYYIKPEGKTLYKIPMYHEQERQRIINHWNKQNKRLNLFKRL